MNLDEAHRRDRAVNRLRLMESTWLPPVRRTIVGDDGDVPLSDSNKLLALVDEIHSAIDALVECLHGTFDEQMQRWLTAPVCTDLKTAVNTVGVGGLIREHFGQPTNLVNYAADLRVVRINRCSVRLCNQRTGLESTFRYTEYDGRDQRWSVPSQDGTA